MQTCPVVKHVLNVFYHCMFQLSELSFIEIREETGELVVLGVQDMDGGQYTCVATNEAGSTQETITLQVGCKFRDDDEEDGSQLLDIAKAIDRVWHRGISNKQQKAGIDRWKCINYGAKAARFTISYKTFALSNH